MRRKSMQMRTSWIKGSMRRKRMDWEWRRRRNNFCLRFPKSEPNQFTQSHVEQQRLTWIAHWLQLISSCYQLHMESDNRADGFCTTAQSLHPFKSCCKIRSFIICTPHQISRLIKLNRMWLVGYVACMAQKCIQTFGRKTWRAETTTKT